MQFIPSSENLNSTDISCLQVFHLTGGFLLALVLFSMIDGARQ